METEFAENRLKFLFYVFSLQLLSVISFMLCFMQFLLFITFEFLKYPRD